MSLLNRLSSGLDNTSHSRPPRGRSGGILFGVRTDWLDRMMSITFILHTHNKSNNFTWTLVTVYREAEDEHKTYFLCELFNLAKDEPYPILLRGILIY